MTEPRPDERGQRAFQLFLKAQETLSQSLAKHAEIVASLEDAIAHEKDGLIAAIDDLVDEMHAHREEMALLRAAIGGAKINIDVLGQLEKMMAGRRR